MGNVTIAHTPYGFVMRSSPQDAATAADMFLDVFRATCDYNKVYMLKAGTYGGGIGIIGIDDSGSEHLIGCTGPISVISKDPEYIYHTYRTDKAEAVRNRTIAALNKAGFRPSFSADC